MVAGVVARIGSLRLLAAADDAACASVAGTGRFDGVFAVIAAPVRRQGALPVAEHRAILVIRERPAFQDQCVGGAALRGQFLQRDARRIHGRIPCAARECRRARQGASCTQQHGHTCAQRVIGNRLEHR